MRYSILIRHEGKNPNRERLRLDSCNFGGCKNHLTKSTPVGWRAKWLSGRLQMSAEKFLQMARTALAGGAAPVPPVFDRGDEARVTARRSGATSTGASAPEPVAFAVPRNVQLLPVPRVLASFASADDVLAGRRLSRGALKLWGYLHDLALDAARERLYVELVRQVVYHCPAVTLAGLLGVTDRHLSRLAHELEAAGLLDCGGHSQQVAGRSMYDGTLWAVLMLPGGEPPRVRAEEWRHNWRPDFISDVEGKTGALAEMSELLQARADEAEKYRAAKARAAVPVGKIPPPLSSSDILPRPCLRSVVEGLAGLLVIHSSKRARAVGALASQIAAALVEPDRRRYWCRVIWDALRGDFEQRAGLQVLSAQILRLNADLEEGAPWKNPGAVLAARLKVA
jgi:hypothetical protein